MECTNMENLLITEQTYLTVSAALCLGQSEFFPGCYSHTATPHYSFSILQCT